MAIIEMELVQDQANNKGNRITVPFYSRHYLIYCILQHAKKGMTMFEALCDIACFVTATVSLLYGTRIAWMCGKKCGFKEIPENRKHLIIEGIPAAAIVYFFGFLIIFSHSMNGFLAIVVFSLTSAILLSGFVISMAMPELKRKPSAD